MPRTGCERKNEGIDAQALRAAYDALNKGTAHLAEILMGQTLEKDLKNKNVRDVLRKN